MLAKMVNLAVLAVCLVGPSLAFKGLGIVSPLNDKPNRFRDEMGSRKSGGVGMSQLGRLGEPWSSKLKMDRPAENRYNGGRGLQDSCSWVPSGRCTTIDGKRTFKDTWARERPARRERYREDAWMVIPSTRVRFIRHHGLRVNPDITDEHFSDDPRFNFRYGRRH